MIELKVNPKMRAIALKGILRKVKRAFKSESRSLSFAYRSIDTMTGANKPAMASAISIHCKVRVYSGRWIKYAVMPHSTASMASDHAKKKNRAIVMGNDA